MKPVLAPFALFAIVFAAPAGVRAAEPEKPAPSKFILHPAAEQSPAMKFQLSPLLIDRRPGNAVIHYLKVPHEQTNLFSDRAFWDTISNWAEMTLPDLRKDVRGPHQKYTWIEGQSPIVEMLERGARCETCDWDIPIREHEFYSILLPDIQSMRSSGRILAARARLQIADAKYDDAVRTLQTGYAFGRHVAHGPTLIQGLVGVAIATQMSDQLETLLQQPGAPNLYWALATLPRPLIDFRYGYEGEFASIYLTYPELRNLDKKDYTPDEWRRLLAKMTAEMRKFMGLEGGPPQAEWFRLWNVPAMLEGYPRAKRFLVANGRSAAEVEAMSVAQVILLYTMQTYDELRDDTFKWIATPFPEAHKGMEQANQRLKKAVAEGREIIPLATMMLPAIFKVKEAEARLSQKIAALEVLEALRIYAAAHDGRLPESLSDITEVPVPLDPFRGEPFHYVRDGNSAKLESPYPSYTPLRYEIQLAKEGTKP